MALAAVQAQAPVITEILYQSPVGGSPDPYEFVEIHNPGTAAYDLSGHELRYNNTTMITFPTGTSLAAGDYIVVASNVDSLVTNMGVPAAKAFATTTQLGNAGATLRIRNASQVVLDSVVYGPGFPAISAGRGGSAVICDPVNLNNGNPSNWRPEHLTAPNGYFASPAAANGVCSTSPYTAVSIASLRPVDANGLPTQLNRNFAINGVVNSGDFRIQNNTNNGTLPGFEFVLSDFQNNGMGIFSNRVNGGYSQVTPGDSLEVRGVLNHFQGLSQITVDTIIVHATGQTQVQPTVVTPPLTENEENRVIRINGASFIPSTWTQGAGPGFNARAVVGNDTITVRIDNDVFWFNQAVPTGTVDIIGVGGQSTGNNNPPFLTGYQVRVRYQSDLVGANPNPNPTYTPASITSLRPVDANGLPTQINGRFSVKGVVNSGDFRIQNNNNNGTVDGFEFILSDFENNGIAIFSSRNIASYPQVNPGDSLEIRGTLDHFRGLSQIIADTVIVLGTGLDQVQPMVVSPPLTENEESRIVRINGLRFIASTWTQGTGGGFNARAVVGTDTVVVRIDNDIYWFNQPVPTGLVDVIGAGGQNTPTTNPPFNTGYQLRVRYQGDIIANTGTNLNQLAQNLQVQIFPNPAQEQLNLVSNEAELQQVRVFNALGQEVQTLLNLNSNQEQLSLNGLANGVYHLQIQTNKGQIMRSFIVRR